MLKKYLLEPFNLPLYGQQLIQASAGTGKTYILIILYLRLLLGLKNFNESKKIYFTVQEILLITFNETLTDILKKNIKSLIIKLKIACLSNKSKNSIVSEFLKKIEDRKKAFLILETAERDFNKASIFNIHTFFIKIFFKYNPSNFTFEYKLIDNEKIFYKQAIKEFWKEKVELIKNFSLYKLLLNFWPSLKHFIKFIEPFLKIKNIETDKRLKSNYLLEDIYKRNNNIIIKIANLFKCLNLNNLIKSLDHFNLNKKIYSLKKINIFYKNVNIWIKKKEKHPIPRDIFFFSLPYLKKHSKLFIKKETYGYNTFLRIGLLLKKIVDIKKFFIYKAIFFIKNKIAKLKNKNFNITYYDILELNEKNFLTKNRKFLNNFPVVLIDEFQDFNSKEINIIYNLFIKPKLKNIILFCDPKQLIYNFMGADISWFFKIKKCIKDIYIMRINWRSSHKFIDNINWLFNKIKKPFLLRNVPFEKIYPSKLNRTLKFKINGLEQKAFAFWYYNNHANTNGISSSQYKKIMAKQCAYQIKEWLVLISQNKAQLIFNNKIRQLNIRDIVILVRDKNEAALLNKELESLQIYAEYSSSYKENIFKTFEAIELMNLLYFLYYNNYNSHHYIASNNILYISSTTTRKSNKVYQSLLDISEYYKSIWLETGVLCMLKTFLKEERVEENLLNYTNKEIILDNILYLGEVIQNKSFNHQEQAYILRWLEKKINGSNYYECKSNNRYTPKNVLNILSIHKSKGLQFPIVCLPFISDFKANRYSLDYYKNKLKNLFFSIEKNKSENILSTNNRLSEDLRLLYVALNRAIFHCCIGIAPISKYKKKIYTDLHKSCLGYLLQKKKIFTVKDTNKLIEEISIKRKNTISVLWLINSFLKIKPNIYSIDTFNAIKLKNIYTNSINKFKTSNEPKIIKSFSNFNFIFKKPRAVKVFNNKIQSNLGLGKLLHYLLEKIKYIVPVEKRWLKDILIMNGYYDKTLFFYLYKWLNRILLYPFNRDGLSLANLSGEPQRRELKFSLYINKTVKLEELNILFKRYIKNQIYCKEHLVLKDTFNGIIDLIFLWKGKYYILDFKSNLIGNNIYHYKTIYLKDIINKKYFWLQYHLYTLAMHRYFILRNKNYDYKRDFGGVFYFFIRAVNYINIYKFEKIDIINKYGIFFDYPNYKLIQKLNELFTKK